MRKTLIVHLAKTKYAATRTVLDGWAQDGLRLANTVLWQQRVWADPTGEYVPAKNKDAALLTRAKLDEIVAERNRPAETDLPFLTPALVKWMFAGNCLSWSEKQHFRALPSKIAQGIVQGVCDDRKGFFAALAAYAADPAKFTGRPQEPGFRKDRDLPTLAFPCSDIDLPKVLLPDGRTTLTFGVRTKDGQKVERTVTLPAVYADAKPLLIRFVPQGGTVATGETTAFGKKVYRAHTWKMEIVFEVSVLTAEEKTAVAVACAAKEKERLAKQVAQPDKGETEDGAAAKKGTKVIATKALTKALRAAETKKAKTGHRKLLVACHAKAKAGTLRVAGGDPGTNNFLTLAFPHGAEPVAWAGAKFLALDEYFSRLAAHATSLATKGTATVKGEHRPDSETVRRLATERQHKFDGWTRMLVKEAVALLAERRVDVLFLGRAGAGWKDGSNLGKDNNRRFQGLPHELFLTRLEAACALAGILTFRVDEAYTSAMSWLDAEKLLDLTCRKSVADLKKEGVLRGRRDGARFFRPDGRQIHADVNGALNIAARGALEVFGLHFDRQLTDLTPTARHRFARPRQLAFLPSSMIGRPRRSPRRTVTAVSKPCSTLAASPRLPGDVSCRRQPMANFKVSVLT